MVANTITWDLSQITSFSFRSVVASFQVPPDVDLIGTDLVSTASVVIAQSEPNTTNNFATGTRTITGAYDPNAKEVRTSSGLSSELYYIDQDTWLDYTIQFQNTGNDTAFFVVVTDTLAETLDPATFKLGARSHACMVEMADHGVLRFIFPNILLPDSTSNEPASHGFVCFRIQHSIESFFNGLFYQGTQLTAHSFFIDGDQSGLALWIFMLLCVIVHCIVLLLLRMLVCRKTNIPARRTTFNPFTNS